ncbi:hypothetical protein PHLGIDRAFT_105753 [Phlebiopsis gigantea 11061_1 CR5-6]|uniref:D-lactate dehydrogenase (cytochrome) n=1 Tax=Phlebiopsis gigantea (strain 11061_1 CR5-6) TaxID=745531 RepID=A0A0C3PLP0_PHLG1|nr:hypothetical protein PHLGIDRAFT_105753 [Phlebiopsis gigantea 11061_1 CR5-6]
MVGCLNTQALSVTSAMSVPEKYVETIEALRAIFPAAEVNTDPDVLKKHSSTFGVSRARNPPGVGHTVVVYPRSTEDVVKIVKISREHLMPITAYGGATSLEGHATFVSSLTSESGGICLDVSKMDKILEIHVEDGDLICQPGVQWVTVNETLKQKGIPLFFPLDPGIGATIGGMISTGCSGTNAVKYGTARGEWFINATVVLPSGEIIKTRRRSRKCSAGFDTLSLFVGAEGTLGIVTEVTIRLTPLLPTRVAVAGFPDVAHASRASTEALNCGVNLQCIELLDKRSMAGLNAFNRNMRQWPEQDSIFFKIQGATQVFIDESARILREVVERNGGSGFEFAATEKEADDLWLARKSAVMAGFALAPGAQAMITDVCVPLSALPQLMTNIGKDLDEAGLLAGTLAHAGDGNMHAMILYRNENEEKIARGVADKLAQYALQLDGTCTGEHGVGVGKKKYLVDELGANTVELMKQIKKTIDPLNLFNPGKLYPD